MNEHEIERTTEIVGMLNNLLEQAAIEADGLAKFVDDISKAVKEWHKQLEQQDPLPGL